MTHNALKLNTAELCLHVFEVFLEIKPNYWFLESRDREIFRMNLLYDVEYEALYIKAKTALFQRLFPELLENAELTREQQYEYNFATQYLIGFGNNYFTFDDYLEEGVTERSFDTLYDFDRYEYEQDNKQKAENTADFKKPDYQGSLYSSWVRYISKGRVRYPALFMVANYITNQVHETGIDYIGELIPHDYIEGPGHGENDGNDFYLWNMIPDANGREEALEKIKNQFYTKYGERYSEDLKREYFNSSKCEVYFLDAKSEANACLLNVVFSTPEALKKVRIRYFESDLEKMRVDNKLIDERVSLEIQSMKLWVEAQLKRIEGC